MSVDTDSVDQSAITRIGVVGSGTMGAGIAELCALRGLDVRLSVSRESSLTAAPRRIAASLERQVAKGRIEAGARDAALARITVGMDLADLSDRDLVIEAGPEDEAVKLELFTALDKATAPSAILASTTSSISITRLAGATTRGARVLGVHFFNPVGVLPLVEIVPTLLSAPEVVDEVQTFVDTVLGKTCVRAADSSGFIVNALLIPYLLAAVRMVESGPSTAAEIDQAMELGCAHPMGPLRLSDLIGLDVVVAIAESLHAEFKQPQYAAPALLLRMVEAGLLGRKTGRGFYSHA
ncbi:3-hydroxybutyryl-CoA dehydrogenase [Actinospica durhamensis]|uniref:3-hydroxybutyryl-CoA dehydrogenase n=1 Tax=Actinospica durhamensis TaxID=1508375 RepID=A0A941EHV7_9ACTN|nr:3-hydroxybutyryl-CoA dehydrogenase [Actinospica durhamensis]